MNIELWALLVAGLMIFLSIFLQTNHTSLVHGLRHNVSNRDTPAEETPLGGRLRRATANGIESIAVFAPLVVVAQLAGVSNVWTQSAAVAFLVSRVLYLPAYALGLVPGRTVVWAVGFFALPVFAFGLLTSPLRAKAESSAPAAPKIERSVSASVDANPTELAGVTGTPARATLGHPTARKSPSDEAKNSAEYKAVEKALQPYIESAKTGDGALTRTAFFDHAHIVGSIGGEFYNMDADAFKDAIDEGGPSPMVQHHISWVNTSGPAAAARVEFTNWQGAQFTDFFVLYEHEGQWKISAKVYDSHANN